MGHRLDGDEGAPYNPGMPNDPFQVRYTCKLYVALLEALNSKDFEVRRDALALSNRIEGLK